MPDRVPVTVLMPVHNGERYLTQAIDSILGQSLAEFELLIVDDGSTDETPEILSRYSDPRLRVMTTQQRGVARTLHDGVAAAQGRYIARMDADDIALPERLERQLAYMERNQACVLCHTLFDCVDENGRIVGRGRGHAYEGAEAKWLLLWMNIIAHPTVMIRAKTMRENGLNYRAETNRAEDFDLWNRLAELGEIGVIRKVLLQYRVHSESITGARTVDAQHRANSLVIGENLSRLGVTIDGQTADELAVLSGRTNIDPRIFSYDRLRGNLRRLAGLVEQCFHDRFGIDPDTTARVRAEQRLWWAKYMRRTSPGEARSLVAAAVPICKGVMASRLFWKTVIHTVAPVWLTNGLRRSRLALGKAPM